MRSNKQTKRSAWNALAVFLTLVATTGCSSAYRCYDGCHVNCRYCPDKPIAYPTYTGCPCHSDAAVRVVGQSPVK